MQRLSTSDYRGWPGKEEEEEAKETEAEEEELHPTIPRS